VGWIWRELCELERFFFWIVSQQHQPAINNMAVAEKETAIMKIKASAIAPHVVVVGDPARAKYVSTLMEARLSHNIMIFTYSIWLIRRNLCHYVITKHSQAFSLACFVLLADFGRRMQWRLLKTENMQLTLAHITVNEVSYGSLWSISCLTSFLVVTVASHGVGGGGASMAFEELIQVCSCLCCSFASTHDDKLLQAGAKVIIRAGTCGSLNPEYREGNLVVVTGRFPFSSVEVLQTHFMAVLRCCSGWRGHWSLDSPRIPRCVRLPGCRCAGKGC